MIKYSLICKNCDLTFESWFASSKEYENLKRKKFLNCHKCNSFEIEKKICSFSDLDVKIVSTPPLCPGDARNLGVEHSNSSTIACNAFFRASASEDCTLVSLI